MILIKQWTNGYEYSLPIWKKGNKKLHRTIDDQIQLGLPNMMRGVLSSRWNVLQNKYDQKMFEKKGRAKRSTQWSGHVSKLLLQYSVTIWKHRCEVIHHLKEGTDEASVRAQLLSKALELQSEPWRLLPSDLHLCKRSVKFFEKARLANLLMWKKRVMLSEVLCERKTREYGNDLSKHFGVRKIGKSVDDRVAVMKPKKSVVKVRRNSKIMKHETRQKTRKRINQT